MPWDAHALPRPQAAPSVPRRIAVVGTGIAGMACAWLLRQRHSVTVYEQNAHIGGHSNTVEAAGPEGPVAVDTGFIVYNPVNYPNLVALFDHLDVPTAESDMSFAVSVGDGALEYAGTDLNGLFAQRRNAIRPRFWRMVRDIVRFYREAPALLSDPAAADVTLGAYLDRNGYGDAFVDDHLLPMAAAIWSTPAAEMRDYPAAAFIRFCDSHGLLTLTDRPQWRTVRGGSREYVRRLTEFMQPSIRLGDAVRSISRDAAGATVRTAGGETARFDDVVIASHADQALSLLTDADRAERDTLGAFRYQGNEAVLHGDPSFMPRRRRVWSSWNFLAPAAGRGSGAPSVTYWMNRLQPLDTDMDLFVTLNPSTPIRETAVHRRFHYAHPVFDLGAMAAQRRLWSLQGRRRTWFCGGYFGAGFHEDALQSGLAVAEKLGGLRRPWRVANESGRIFLRDDAATFEVAA